MPKNMGKKVIKRCLLSIVVCLVGPGLVFAKKESEAVQPVSYEWKDGLVLGAEVDGLRESGTADAEFDFNLFARQKLGKNLDWGWTFGLAGKVQGEDAKGQVNAWQESLFDLAGGLRLEGGKKAEPWSAWGQVFVNHGYNREEKDFVLNPWYTPEEFFTFAGLGLRAAFDQSWRSDWVELGYAVAGQVLYPLSWQVTGLHSTWTTSGQAALVLGPLKVSTELEGELWNLYLPGFAVKGKTGLTLEAGDWSLSWDALKAEYTGDLPDWSPASLIGQKMTWSTAGGLSVKLEQWRLGLEISQDLWALSRVRVDQPRDKYLGVKVSLRYKDSFLTLF